MRFPSLLFATMLPAFLGLVGAQQLPQIVPEAGVNPDAATILATACTVEDDDDDGPRSADLPSRQTPEWQAERERRRAYRVLYPAFLAAVPLERDDEVLMPVAGVTMSQVADTWGAARSEGRTHEGTDIFAAEGTSVYSATPGYVQRIGSSPIGGNLVTVIGGGGVRYYYAHLSGFNEALQEGQYVTPATVLGYVGNTGNAITTPPHLHFGIYAGEDPYPRSYLTCDWEAENPYPLLSDRSW